MHNFLTNHKITKAKAATAAGQTTVYSSIIDMQGFEGVTFIVTVLAITSGGVQSIKLQEDTDSAGGTMADLTGTAITIADDDDNQTFAIELFRPFKRYVRLGIVRGTQDSAFGEVYAIQSLPTTPAAPISNNRTDVITSEIHIESVAGTA